MANSTGRHLLQVPGPTNVPERILRAMYRATIDHRGPEFAIMAREILAEMGDVFKTEGRVVIYPASGTGAWEAALTNTLSPGDTVLMYETGYFAVLWQQLATRLGLRGELLPGNLRRGADPRAIEARLKEDAAHEIKAVCIVHNETSTGVVSAIPAIRDAMDSAKHPALLMVDTISSLASMDYRMDEWGVDVTVAGSQKGLMLPPGLSFNALNEKALAASREARLPNSYWDWAEVIAANDAGHFFPYTPATNMLFGLREALRMLKEEGLETVFARHQRHAEATRSAVRAWGLGIQCEDPAAYSDSLTTVELPAGHDADRLRDIILTHFNMSLGAGLGGLAGKVFRIGHLGSLNDLMVVAALSGVEMGMKLAGIPHRSDGVATALDFLAESRTFGGQQEHSDESAPQNPS